MAIRLGDTAPDFSAETTQGRIDFHEWLGDSLALVDCRVLDHFIVAGSAMMSFAERGLM